MREWLKKLYALVVPPEDTAANALPETPIEVVIVSCPYEQEKRKKEEAPAWRLRLELDLHRDGKYAEVEDREPAEWVSGEKGTGAVLPFNNDGDNGSLPRGDNEDNRIIQAADLADLTELRIRLEPPDKPFPQGWMCILAVNDARRIRIFDSHQAGAREMIGPTSKRDYVLLKLHSDDGHHAPPLSQLGMEATCLPGGDFDGNVEVGIQLLDQDGEPVAEERVARLRITPWLMTHHLQPVERVYVIDKHVKRSMPPLPGMPMQEWTERDPAVGGYVDRLGQVLGSTLHAVQVIIDDNWARDMFYGGYTLGPTMAEPILQILRCPTIRDRKGEQDAYDAVQQAHVGPGHGYAVPIPPRDKASDLDSGGNILCAPPLEGYPLGRIVYGHDDKRPMSQDIVAFLQAQGLQAPFHLDTSWLQVGHIDEVLTFIPWPKGKDPKQHSAHGFRVLLPSPRLALDLVKLSQPGNLLFRGLHQQAPQDRLVPTDMLSRQKQLSDIRDFTCASVGASALLAKAAEELEPLIDKLAARLQEELKLGPDDIVRLPVLFHRYGSVPHQSGQMKNESMLAMAMGGRREQHRTEHVAYTPNVVNMLVVTAADGRATLCIPKPYGPSSGGNQQYGCSFEAYIRARLEGSGNTIAFIDNFEACHIQTGEVHCSTFEVRSVPKGTPGFWMSQGGSTPVTSSPPEKPRPSEKKPSVSASDWLSTLNHGAFLDDEAMRRFYEVLRQRHAGRALQFVNPTNSYLILNNVNEAEAAAELASLTQNDADLVFFPVNNNRNSASAGGTHWTLIVYDRLAGRFNYYDSLNRQPDDAANRAHTRLKQLYQTQAALTQIQAPQQQESECGVYVLLITEHLAERYVSRAAPDMSVVAAIQNPRQRVRAAVAPVQAQQSGSGNSNGGHL